MNTYQITRYGHTFTIRVDDQIMETHYRKGELCEHHMLDWIEKNIPKGGTWIDAGANVGNHTLPFALWADQVIAFEPIMENFKLLSMNLAGTVNDDRVLCVFAGVGAKPGRATAKVGGTGQNCQWELTPAQGDEWDAVFRITTIDKFAADLDDVRLIKLDVEGMELAAIHGALKTIERCRPEMFVEIWDEAILWKITAELEPFGYVLTERYNVAPTFHFSASGRYPVTYKPAERLRP